MFLNQQQFKRILLKELIKVACSQQSKSFEKLKFTKNKHLCLLLCRVRNKLN